MTSFYNLSKQSTIARSSDMSPIGSGNGCIGVFDYFSFGPSISEIVTNRLINIDQVTQFVIILQLH